MVEPRNVAFEAEGGDHLRGWLFTPATVRKRYPAMSMAHGYGGVKEHGLRRFAQAFTEAGFVVLVHDHRNFGVSDGAIRHDIDPWCQIADWRRAISFLESQPNVDPGRMGIWGTSYAGGHVLVLGATDRRIRAVVSQVPTISGYQQGLRRVAPDAVEALERQFDEDERTQFRGEPPRRQQIVNDDPAIPAAYRSKDAIAFYFPRAFGKMMSPCVQVASPECMTPGIGSHACRPPLLMIVALEDRITQTDLQLRAYEQALEPKKLVTIEGGHFDPYVGQFDRVSAAAVSWFAQHLNAIAPGHEEVRQ